MLDGTFAQRLCESFNACAADAPLLLQRVHGNVRSMLESRGYHLTLVATADELAAAMGREESVIAGTHPSRGDICVFYLSADRVGVGALRTLLQKTVAERVVILSIEGPTNFTKKESEQRGVQYFTYRDLVIDRARHHLVPKHTLVPASDHPSREEYPKLLVQDPMAQYYDFLVGDVVRVDRVVGNSEQYRMYRLVCA